MTYTIKFTTTIEWEISDEDQAEFITASTPEHFIGYQEGLLNGSQSLEDFVSQAVIKEGHWGIYTNDAVEHGGEWNNDEAKAQAIDDASWRA